MQNPVPLEKLLVQHGALYIQQLSNRTSLITITRATIATDRKRATIFLTVLPEDKAQEALTFVSRHRSDMRAFIQKHARRRNLPGLHFALDDSFSSDTQAHT